MERSTGQLAGVGLPSGPLQLLRKFPVRMAAGWRESTLHSGWRPIYYCYKMLLSLWALSGVPRSGPT